MHCRQHKRCPKCTKAKPFLWRWDSWSKYVSPSVGRTYAVTEEVGEHLHHRCRGTRFRYIYALSVVLPRSINALKSVMLMARAEEKKLILKRTPLGVTVVKLPFVFGVFVPTLDKVTQEACVIIERYLYEREVQRIYVMEQFGLNSHVRVVLHLYLLTGRGKPMWRAKKLLSRCVNIWINERSGIEQSALFYFI